MIATSPGYCSTTNPPLFTVSNSKTLLFSHSPLRPAMAWHQTLQLLVFPCYHDHHHHPTNHSPASPVPCRIGHEKQLNVHNMLEELHKSNKLSHFISNNFVLKLTRIPLRLIWTNWYIMTWQGTCFILRAWLRLREWSQMLSNEWFKVKGKHKTILENIPSKLFVTLTRVAMILHFSMLFFFQKKAYINEFVEHCILFYTLFLLAEK